MPSPAMAMPLRPSAISMLVIPFPPRPAAVDEGQLPFAAVILCVRCADPSLPACVHGLFQQDYPRFQIRIVLDSAADPAFEVLCRAMGENPPSNLKALVLESPEPTCSLKVSALMQAVDKQSWDPSVKALTEFPSVLDNMSKNLAWTSSLGQAYHDQQADVMTAIQTLRAQAKAKGNLNSSPQITVVQQSPQTIVIQPANPQIVYVPQYNPTIVYGTPYVVPGYVAPAYTAGDVAAAGIIGFGAGIAVGAMMSHGCCSWGYSSWNCGWHGTAVVYHGGAYYGNSAWHGGYYNNGYHGSNGYNNNYNHSNYNSNYNRSNYNKNVSGNTVNVNKQGSQNFNHSSSSNSWAQHSSSGSGHSDAFSGMSGHSGGSSGGWSSKADSSRGWGSMHSSGFSGGRFGGGGSGGGGFRGGGRR